MSSISPPSLIILTVGAFNSVYNAFFNYPERPKEIKYFAVDLVLDTLAVGSLSYGVDALYKHSNKVLAWCLVAPLFLVMLVSMIVILLRMRIESKKSSYENVTVKQKVIKRSKKNNLEKSL
jgi:uncharacterized membrane protein